MNFTDENQMPAAGILLFVDFEKAFDTLKWTFIHKAGLEMFNFGPKIRKWVSILHSDIKSGVMSNAGYMTNWV